MADNSVRTPGSGETIRSVDKSTVKSQVVIIDWGGSGTEDVGAGAVGRAAQDAAISGNPLAIGARASTATPSAMSADGDVVFLWVDRSGAVVNTGYVAEDGAIAGNPIRIGGRAHAGVPTAMSTDNDVVSPWYDLSGAAAVIPQVRQSDLVGQPTIDTAVYADGDRLGAVITFSNAALASGRTGTIVNARMVDDAASNFDIELWLFQASPTMVNADNGVFDITDANIATAGFLGVIDFLASNSRIVGSSTNRICQGTWLNGPVALPYVTSGSSSIFGIMRARGAYDAAATDDLVVTLTVIRD